jgi:hypothetical protein
MVSVAARAATPAAATLTVLTRPVGSFRARPGRSEREHCWALARAGSASFCVRLFVSQPGGVRQVEPVALRRQLEDAHACHPRRQGVRRLAPCAWWCSWLGVANARTQDFRVVDTEGLSTFTALQRRGVPSELLYFPEESHWVLSPANSIVWHDSVLRWLDRWCGVAREAQPPAAKL